MLRDHVRENQAWLLQREQTRTDTQQCKVQHQRIRMAVTHIGHRIALRNTPFALQPRRCALDTRPETAVGNHPVRQ